MRGDLNDDGLIDDNDLIDLVAVLFATDAPPSADVNGDGRVSAADLSALILLLDEQ